MNDLLAIYRAERFSPNSVEKDKAILDSVCRCLASDKYNIRYAHEETLAATEPAPLILSMGREQSTLEFLEQAEARGAVVVNSVAGVRACTRAAVDSLMRRNDIPAAPLKGDCGYWIKRGEEAAQCPDDVQFARDEAAVNRVLESFKARGIMSTVVTAHVEGDLVKFYGVFGTDFFCTFYPGDDGCFKFNDEMHNGHPQHFNFNSEALMADANKLAALTGVKVYGGDCIVRGDGSYAIIDFNDWPSFSRCREKAAEAIAGMVRKAVHLSLHNGL